MRTTEYPNAMTRIRTSRANDNLLYYHEPDMLSIKEMKFSLWHIWDTGLQSNILSMVITHLPKFDIIDKHWRLIFNNRVSRTENGVRLMTEDAIHEHIATI